MKGKTHPVSSVDDVPPAPPPAAPTGGCPVRQAATTPKTSPARASGAPASPGVDSAPPDSSRRTGQAGRHPAGTGHSPADTSAGRCPDIDTRDPVARQTLAWVHKAVIGQNFCPFANAVVRKQRLRIHVSPATDASTLLAALQRELTLLHATPVERIETTLLVIPQMLGNFPDFNDFLDQAEHLLHDMNLDGLFQIASFHPHYQFAGSDADDIENATNQSPWPTLHLLRESSIDRAVAAWGDDTDRIYEDNMARLRSLGRHGWQHVQAHWQPDAADGRTETGDSPPAASR